MGFYTKVIKPIAFRIDPETTHDLTIKFGGFLGKHFLTRKLISFFYNYRNEKLENNILGINFKNPVGLAAGFDKNALIADLLPSVGFGFLEIGSITAQPCQGNQKPRLWRLPKDNSIAVYYGLCNDGAEIVKKRLQNKKSTIPIAASIAKTSDSKIKGKDSVEDYYKSFNLMKNTADFLVLNISCPNTGDGCTFEDPKLLNNLLKRIDNKNKIIFLKVSSGLEKNQADKIIQIANRHNVQGFVIGNLNKKTAKLKSTKEELAKVKGGLSGDPVRKESDELIKYVYKKTKGKYVIIGVGGIFTAEHAYTKIKNGASLVQVITGMIYKGPGIVKEINKGLVKLLEKDGYKNISEAIGKNIR